MIAALKLHGDQWRSVETELGSSGVSIALGIRNAYLTVDGKVAVLPVSWVE